MTPTHPSVWTRPGRVGADRRWRMRIGVAVLVLAFALSWSPEVRADEPKYGGTLIVALAGNPIGFNPGINYATLTHLVTGQVFNSLVSHDYDMTMVPELARSWTVSPDSLTITFTLEPNVTFHDGKPLTSADVKFSLEEISRKHHPLGQKIFGYVDRIETPAPQTVVFRMKQAYPPMLSFLGGWYASILPKHLYEGTDPLKNPANLNPVGTGPFKFKEFVSGSHVILERNPNYWRKGKPYLDRIVFKIVPDEAARVIAFERGELDLQGYYGFPFSEVERLKKLPGVKVTFDPTSFAPLMMVPINVRGPILAKREVRQALAYAVNRDEILQRGLFGIGKVATSPIPTDLAWAHNPKVKRYGYDPTEANRLLDAAGQKRGADGTRFKISIYFDGGRQAHRKTAEIMRENLRAVGVDLELRGTELSSLMDAVYKAWNFDLVLHDVAMGPHPAVGTARFYTSDQIVKIPFTNGMGYSNPEVDRLFTEAAQAGDRKRQAELYGRIQEILVQDSPVLWLAEPSYPNMFRADFMGLPVGPLRNERMDGVWWTKGKPGPPGQ